MMAFTAAEPQFMFSSPSTIHATKPTHCLQADRGNYVYVVKQSAGVSITSSGVTAPCINLLLLDSWHCLPRAQVMIKGGCWLLPLHYS